VRNNLVDADHTTGGKENTDFNHASLSTTKARKLGVIGRELQQIQQEPEKAVKASPSSMSATWKTQGLRLRTPQTAKQLSSNYHSHHHHQQQQQQQQVKKTTSFSLSPAFSDVRSARTVLNNLPSKSSTRPVATTTAYETASGGSPPTFSSSSNMVSSNININSDSQRRVLLFGETMESLFGITEYSDEEQRQLCRTIVDGSHADDPATWRRALQIANNIQNDNSTASKEATSVDLVRLHRRATLRFALDHKSHVHAMTSQKRRDVIEIWLRFARVHIQSGNIDEARRTFRFLDNNLKVLLSGKDDSFIPSSFYVAFSDFERIQGRSPTIAKEIILRGIQEKAHPSDVLEQALTLLREVELRSIRSQPHDQEKEMLHEQQQNTSTKIENGSRKRSPENSTISEKSSKSRFGSETIEGRTYKSGINKYVLPDDKDDLTGYQPRTIDNRKIVTVTSLNTFIPQNSTDESSTKTPKQTSAIVAGTCDPALGKPPAAQRSSLASRLRMGLSGKAKRVEAEKSILSLDDGNTSESDSEEDTCGGVEVDVLQKPQWGGSGDSKLSLDRSKKAPTIKKVDLGYMWAWDPNSRKTGQNDTQQENHRSHKLDEGVTSNGQSTNATHNNSLSTHGSGSSRDSVSSSVKEEVAHRSNTQQLEEPQTGQNLSLARQSHSSRPNHGNEIGSNATKEDATAMHEQSLHTKHHALVAKANLDFLPLVHEDNILKVNGSSYVKLGVVGKGGSCKVYRALSKKCAVVAIKKVKLDGIDKKAVDGYANEISLLKRLRGNPAIIQMYDSEVDLKRKFIYLVMELGEVDLNHVLQQRALADTSRSLNLNFIRLTWQQMLSAVHCIHEERIIHSDLKPANFLFVRGALKLIDFGIAKAIANEDTTKIVRESHIGTLNYMSPESILDTGSGNNGPRMKIGRASDVWSLGCILYEMVYGKTPFAKLHFVQKLQAIINDDYQIDFPEADESSVDAMKLCLRRNPDERPPIMGKGGLLNEHYFLHSSRTK
jgi:serine/threonine-protein kinase TTK/MPS1